MREVYRSQLVPLQRQKAQLNRIVKDCIKGTLTMSGQTLASKGLRRKHLSWQLKGTTNHLVADGLRRGFSGLGVQCFSTSFWEVNAYGRDSQPAVETKLGKKMGG